jgi:fucose permease
MVQLTALMAAFGVGMCFSLLGSVSVKLMPRLNMDTGRFGSLVSALMLTAVVSSILVGLGIDTWGHKPFAIIGFLVAGASIFTIARSKSFGAVFCACMLLGLGAMCLSNVGNTLLPVVLFEGRSPAAAINLGNVAFGLGLFLTPFIASFLFQRTSFENAVSALAVIAIVPVVFALAGRGFPEVKLNFHPSDAFGLLTQPMVIVAGLALFCYISLESSFSNWIAPYSKQIISADFPSLSEAVVDAASQRMLSIFAVAMMVGRLLASQIAAIEAHGAWVVAILAVVACAVILAMTRSGAMWSGLLVACGSLAFSAIFPTVAAIAYSRYPDKFGTVFGIIFAVGLLGAVIVPKAIGNMARGMSVQKSLRLLLPIGAALLILAVILSRI